MAVALRFPPGARIAALASGAMIAQQVAGKATRDALFLSSFKVVALPQMMVVSAVVSLFAVLWLSGLMVRYSPARVVPIAFALSGAGLLGIWGVSFFSPRLAAVVLYLHTALFGAVVISAFWSLINERFSPHAGRRAVTLIAGGGTMGGVVGGLLAWRAADQIALPSMLPLLAAINLVCMWGTWRLRTVAPTIDEDVTLLEPGDQARDAHPTHPPTVEDARGPADAPRLPLFRTVFHTPYLRNLALVVALGAVTSGLLDYVFSAVAVATYSSGPALLGFFAKFWLVVGGLSFLLQTLFGRIALEKLGLAVTVALLPALVFFGGALGIAVPGLFSMVLLRGGEATQRNSLFRAAYELLYTPLSAEKKRATKTLIDVGFDRLGTVLAGGVAMATVHVYSAPRAGMILLVIAMGCALVSVARSLPLHRGYVALLEEGLRRAADEMKPSLAPSIAPPAQEAALRDAIVEQLEPEFERRAPGAKVESIDDVLQAVLALRSGERARVNEVLATSEPLTAPLVAFTVLLLADKELHLAAIDALVRAAPTSTGQLVDSLCDPRVDFHTRRRIPRVLGRCPTVAAAEGLLRGLEAERFEVRYACGRALLKIRAATPELAIALERIVEIVTRELERDTKALRVELEAAAGGGPNDDDDDDDDDNPSLVDRLRRDRLDRTVEHIFNVLALYLDPESLRTAFKALHEEDEVLRGTALEYLETVLPNEVRDLVWPFLGEARPMRAARPAEEILADLRRARDT